MAAVMMGLLAADTMSVPPRCKRHCLLWRESAKRWCLPKPIPDGKTSQWRSSMGCPLWKCLMPLLAIVSRGLPRMRCIGCRRWGGRSQIVLHSAICWLRSALFGDGPLQEGKTFLSTVGSIMLWPVVRSRQAWTTLTVAAF